jgi:hypothetical protein
MPHNRFTPALATFLRTPFGQDDEDLLTRPRCRRLGARKKILAALMADYLNARHSQQPPAPTTGKNHQDRVDGPACASHCSRMVS